MFFFSKEIFTQEKLKERRFNKNLYKNKILKKHFMEIFFNLKLYFIGNIFQDKDKYLQTSTNKFLKIKVNLFLKQQTYLTNSIFLVQKVVQQVI